MTIFSFFSGAGFLDLGFEDAGFQIAYVNEFNSSFLEAYKHSRRSMKHHSPQFGYDSRSITDLTEAAEISRLRQRVKEARRNGSLVGFIGGPPCPDFSIGGKNRGRHGDNGKLSATYIKLICSVKPDFFLFENVKGLLSTTRHRLFYEELKKLLIEAGYRLSDRLINSIEYGVAQDRDRIMLVGFHKRVLVSSLVKNGELLFNWNGQRPFDAETVFALPWPTVSPFRPFKEVAPPKNLPRELTVEFWFRRNEVRKHPNFSHCFKPRAGLARFKSVLEGDDSRKSFKRLHRWRYSPTACYGNNEVHLHPYEPRRISVAEALAIQSLPMNFELPDSMPLSHMFKTVGNGVPYLAAKALATAIHDHCAVLGLHSSREQLSLPAVVSA